MADLIHSVVRSREDVPVKNPDPDEGLNAEQVQLRTSCGWDNVVVDVNERTEKDIIKDNCLTFFNIVFVVLAVMLVIGGSSIKNMSFLLFVVINAAIGIVQEIRAKRAVDALTLVAEQNVKAVRSGRIKEVPSHELVRDDIVEFSAGDQICADAIVRTGSMQVNESLITGEADAIVKQEGDELKSGSFVIAGRCRAQLTKVGNDSFAAKLAADAKANPQATKSEMMRSLDSLIRIIGFALIPVGIAMIAQGVINKMNWTKNIESTVAALVGMIPQGLYLLTSVAMAVSAMKLTKKKVLVQDMNCIETLARVDVLCVDKTGTITEPRMEVENIVPLTTDSHDYLEKILTALYGQEEPDNDTARALHEVFSGRSSWVCTKRIPFTSATKWAGAVFRDQGAFLTGAPEFILGSRYEDMRGDIEPWSAKGYRVLLIAEYDGVPEPGALHEDWVKPLALVLLTNRIRPEAPETFRYFAQQGVTVKVISGDNPATVSDVARRAGIENAEDYIDAGVLETEEDFLRAVETYTVFGRVTPDKKKSLIQALKEQGHIVAMTGDGVNDVLAMKEAHCGIAMASGAQAASQVASLVLLENDFSTMPDVVGEGRRVINNIQRAATLFLAKNIYAFVLAIIACVGGTPFPMMPLHIDFISMLTIGIPSFFLALEPNYERVEGRFITGVLRRAFPGGLTNVFVGVMALVYMSTFNLTFEQVSTICAALLAIVGLEVLYEVSRPVKKFRAVIWWAMLIGLAVCFFFFSSIFELEMHSRETVLVMVTLVIMTPTVFRTAQKVFDWGDKAWAWIQKKRHGC